MSGKRYSEEFKIQSVKQGHSASSVATRLDITTHSLYAWIKKYVPPTKNSQMLRPRPANSRRILSGLLAKRTY